MRKYEIFEKIVKDGESKIFAEWQKFGGITQKQFLEGLAWLCEDPENGGRDGRHATREIGLELGRVVKLRRVYGPDGLCAFYDEDGRLWGGAQFRVPCDNSNFADKDGMISRTYKVSLSVRDRI